MKRKRPKQPPLGPVVPMPPVPVRMQEPKFILTPAQHRERAARFRLYALVGHPKATRFAELAASHEMLATMIENRLKRQRAEQRLPDAKGQLPLFSELPREARSGQGDLGL